MSTRGPEDTRLTSPRNQNHARPILHPPHHQPRRRRHQVRLPRPQLRDDLRLPRGADQDVAWGRQVPVRLALDGSGYLDQLPADRSEGTGWVAAEGEVPGVEGVCGYVGGGGGV